MPVLLLISLCSVPCCCVFCCSIFGCCTAIPFLQCIPHPSALQAIASIAHDHGASAEQALPLNTAYVCWHLARHKQLGSVLDMVASASGRPHLTASFTVTVSRFGQQSNAGTLIDLMEVCCSWGGQRVFSGAGGGQGKGICVLGGAFCPQVSFFGVPWSRRGRWGPIMRGSNKGKKDSIECVCHQP